MELMSPSSLVGETFCFAVVIENPGFASDVELNLWQDTYSELQFAVSLERRFLRQQSDNHGSHSDLFSDVTDSPEQSHPMRPSVVEASLAPKAHVHDSWLYHKVLRLANGNLAYALTCASSCLEFGASRCTLHVRATLPLPLDKPSHSMPPKTRAQTKQGRSRALSFSEFIVRCLLPIALILRVVEQILSIIYPPSVIANLFQVDTRGFLQVQSELLPFLSSRPQATTIRKNINELKRIDLRFAILA
jgi:hypothetical protein